MTGVLPYRDPRRFREADRPAAGARGGDGGARGAVTGQAAAIGLNDLGTVESLWQSVNSGDPFTGFFNVSVLLVSRSNLAHGGTMLIAQLLAVSRLDAQLPPDVRRDLVQSLYGPFRSLAVGAVAGSAISLSVAYRTEDLWLTICSMMLTLVAVGRIVSAWWYRRSRHTGDFATVKLWEQIYFGGAALFSALLGAVACLAFVRTGDFTAHLVTATTAAGYAAGITGRNAGRPHIALAQVVLSVGPMAAAFLLAQDSLHVKLGLVIVLFAYALTDITLSARNIIVQALVSTRENAALVKRYAAQAALFDSALNNMSHGLCMFDHNRRLVVSNERFAELSGLPQSAIRTGIGLRELLRLSVEAGNHHGRRARRLLNELDQGLQSVLRNRLWCASDGKTLALTRRFMADGGSVIIFEDITARRETEAHVARLAAFDELTALPNV